MCQQRVCTSCLQVTSKPVLQVARVIRTTRVRYAGNWVSELWKLKIFPGEHAPGPFWDTRGFATQSSSIKFLTPLRPFDLPKAYDFAEEIIYDITAKLYSQSSNINQSQRQMREICK